MQTNGNFGIVIAEGHPSVPPVSLERAIAHICM